MGKVTWCNAADILQAMRLFSVAIELLTGCCIQRFAALLLLLLLLLQIIKQVKKLIYVKDVSDITSVPYVARELMLVKVRVRVCVSVSLRVWGVGAGKGKGVNGLRCRFLGIGGCERFVGVDGVSVLQKGGTLSVRYEL
jgi:hypothetical protein